MCRPVSLVTVLILALLGVLCIFEYTEYLRIHHEYEYLVDPSVDSKLTINLDIVIATPCLCTHTIYILC
jgi:hypothetical protein